jgi:hypothetical protein
MTEGISKHVPDDQFERLRGFVESIKESPQLETYSLEAEVAEFAEKHNIPLEEEK